MFAKVTRDTQMTDTLTFTPWQPHHGCYPVSQRDTLMNAP